jgi:hypothetical protein
MTIDLQRIRHHAREAAKFVTDSLGTRVLEQDVPALIAEIQRLQAEIKEAVAWAEIGRRDREQLRARLGAQAPCCDIHGRNCEPPSELCCRFCTEAAHPEHLDSSTCSAPDLSRRPTGGPVQPGVPYYVGGVD